MSFKDMVERDIDNVFINDKEFAEERNVIYDGITYERIKIVISEIKETVKKEVNLRNSVDNVQDIHNDSIVVHIKLSDLCGIIPRHDRDIKISDGEALGKPFYLRYRIITSFNNMGMIRLELEAYDE